MKSMLKFCIFPNDSILNYYNKGEIKEGYFNPKNLFDEIHVISLFDEEIQEDKIRELGHNASFKIHKIGKANLFNYKKFETKVIEILKGIKPNLIRAYNPNVQGWLAVKTAKKINIPVVVSLHTNYFQQIDQAKKDKKLFQFLKLKYVSKNLQSYVLKNADAVICVYEFIVEYAKQMEAHNINVIYNKVDLKKFSPDCEKAFISQKPIILSVGQLIKQKDHSLLIEAVKDMDVQLLLIGDGPNNKKLRCLVKKLKLDEKIKFWKKIPHKDVNKIYASSTIYAQPMVNLGGIPIPVLEAMATGLPIVMSKREENTKELIDDAIYFVNNTPMEFTKAFKKILSNNKFRQQLKNKSLETIKKIDGSKMEEKELQLYLKLINKQF